jgi:hypothetical protein
MKCRRSWDVLNAVVLSALVAHMVSTSCQFFVVGRTEKECAVLHTIAAIFHLIGVRLVRVFFTARVSMLSLDSNLLIRRGLVGVAKGRVGNAVCIPLCYQTRDGDHQVTAARAS